MVLLCKVFLETNISVPGTQKRKSGRKQTLCKDAMHETEGMDNA
jgi:hypothetical protein